MAFTYKGFTKHSIPLANGSNENGGHGASHPMPPTAHEMVPPYPAEAAPAFPFVPSGVTPTTAITDKPVVPVGPGGLPQPKSRHFESNIPFVQPTYSPAPTPSVHESPPPVAMTHQGPFSLITAAREQEVEPLIFRLNPLLHRLSVQQLGFDPRRVPTAVETRIPFSEIEAQLPNGRVVVPLSLVVDGLDERLRPAFSKAQPNLPIELPIQEVIQQLPELPERVEEAPFTVASTPAAVSEPSMPVSPFAPAPFQPLAPVVVTHESSPTGLWEDERVPAAAAPSPMFSPSAPMPQVTVPQAVAPVPIAPPEAPPAEPMPAPVSVAPPVAPPLAPPTAPPVAASAPAPVSPPVVKHSHGGCTRSGLNLITQIDDSPEQMVLRAVLGTGEPLSARQVLGHASRIPGVLSVVGIHDGQAVWPDTAPTDPLTQEFADTASQRFFKVRELLREFGNEHFEIFTVNLGPQTISFFSSTDCALAVLHKDAHLPSGVREKMVVISRHLGALLRA